MSLPNSAALAAAPSCWPSPAPAPWLQRASPCGLNALANEPWSIGTAASSGCIRLFNQDAIDLHRRTPVGSKVVVLAHG